VVSAVLVCGLRLPGLLDSWSPGFLVSWLPGFVVLVLVW
jgi:hypothetical protein